MKNSNHMLSIIVPVYNAESTLRCCMESILCQTYRDFEVILVDDGSTDESPILCEKYAQIDTRVTVIHIKNSGSFQARKLGVENARGNILTFSDADDWFDGNAFEIAMHLFSKYDPDILAYTYVYDNGKTEENIYEDGLYYRAQIKAQIIPGMMYDFRLGGRKLNPSLCCKLIKRKLYETVTRSVGDRITFGEDAIVTYPAVCLAESIYIYNKGLYHYSNNVDSCTHTYPLERITEVKAFQKNMYRLFDEIGMLVQVKAQAENYVRSFLAMMIENWYGIGVAPFSFAFPYNKIEKNSTIVIYGAGDVGRSYITELSISGYAKVVGWADKGYDSIKEYNGVKVIAPERIKEKDYDVLLIAVWDEGVAKGIETDLLSKGVPKERIVWIKPKRII